MRFKLTLWMSALPWCLCVTTSSWAQEASPERNEEERGEREPKDEEPAEPEGRDRPDAESAPVEPEGPPRPDAEAAPAEPEGPPRPDAESSPAGTDASTRPDAEPSPSDSKVPHGEGVSQEQTPSEEPEPSRFTAPAVPVEQSSQPSELGRLRDLSLEQLLEVNVVTATKTEVSLQEAPADISVIHRAEILRWGYSSVAEVLKHTIGFYVIDDHVQANAGVRGIGGGLFTENGFIKVMIDGQSVAFRSDAVNWIGPELIPMTAIERIEIIRGPASALYGADAFLATINVITRQGEAIQGGTISPGVRLYEKQDPALDFDSTIGGRNGPYELFLSGRVWTEDRSQLRLPDTSPAPNIPSYRTARVSRGADHSTQSLFGRATYHLNDTDKVSLVGYYSEFERGSEFSPWAQLVYGLDDAGRLHQTRIALRQMRVGSTGHFAFGDEATLDYRLFYGQGGPSEADRIDVGSTTFAIEREFGFNSIEGAVDVYFPLTNDLDVVVSTDTSVDRIEVPRAIQILNFSTEGLPAGSSIESGTPQNEEVLTNVGVLLQATWKRLAPWLALTGGARVDYHSIYHTVPSGRLVAVSKPLEDLTLKLMYGTAFKAPSPLLLFGTPLTVGDIIGNPDLDPQRVHTVEFQPTWIITKSLAVSSAITYSRLIDGAQFVQQGLNRTAKNVASIDTLSWENSVRVESEDRGASLGYELNTSQRDLGFAGYEVSVVREDRQPRYPASIVRLSAWSSIPALPLQVAAQAQYSSARASSDTNSLENGAAYELDPIWLLDVRVATEGLQLLENRETQVAVHGRNLLNSDGPEPGFAGVDYPLMPLSVSLQFRQEL